MYEFWYDIEYDAGKERLRSGGEFHGNNAQECADYIREHYIGYKNFEIISMVRVENEWK